MGCRDRNQGRGKSQECLRFLAWETERTMVAMAEIVTGRSGRCACRESEQGALF